MCSLTGFFSTQHGKTDRISRLECFKGFKQAVSIFDCFAINGDDDIAYLSLCDRFYFAVQRADDAYGKCLFKARLILSRKGR